MRYVLALVSLVAVGATSAHAYQIKGYYAQLISCDFEYSAVRGESGYTGTYDVMGEIFTVYFGSNYCQY
jgi:hypothetical protein